MSTLFLCIEDKRTVLTSDRRGATRLVWGSRHHPNIVSVCPLSIQAEVDSLHSLVVLSEARATGQGKTAAAPGLLTSLIIFSIRFMQDSVQNRAAQCH